MDIIDELKEWSANHPLEGIFDRAIAEIERLRADAVQVSAMSGIKERKSI